MDKELLRKLRIKEFLIINIIMLLILGFMVILSRVGLLTSHRVLIVTLLILLVDMTWNLIKKKPLSLGVIFPSLAPLNDYNLKILDEEKKKTPFWASLIFVIMISYFMYHYKSNVLLMSDYKVAFFLAFVSINLQTMNQNHNVNYCAKHGTKSEPKTEKAVLGVVLALNLLILFVAILVVSADFLQ